MALRINIGCGQTPIEGWNNYDNSPVILFSRFSVLVWILYKIGILDRAQVTFSQIAKKGLIRYANAARRIPEVSFSADAVYSSHMFEHLDSDGVMAFLAECQRVLSHSGVIRIVVPDLRRLAEKYIEDGDAESFIRNTMLASNEPTSCINKIKFLVMGNRGHRWMYDGKSICKLLLLHGFVNPKVMAPGVTMIKDPAGLDLFERSSESIYVEAINP